MNKQIKQIGLANDIIYALYDDGYYFYQKLEQKLELDKPDNFTEDIKYLNGMKKMCAVNNSGYLGCWDTQSYVFDEILPKYKKDIKFVNTHNYRTCVITINNGFKCWTYYLKPVIKSDFRENIIKVYTKGPYICAIRIDSVLRCWYAYEKLVDYIIDLENAQSISIQYEPNKLIIKFYVLLNSKELYSIKSDDIYIENPSSFKSDIIKVDSGRNHSCSIKIKTYQPTPNTSKSPGSLDCWDGNHYGESSTPSSFSVVSSIALGDYHTCAISPRMMACWGNNMYGQTTVPVAARAAYAVLAVTHTCALVVVRQKSRIGCWGDNDYGQTHVPQFIYSLNSVFDDGGSSDAGNEILGFKKEIVSLVTGCSLSGGVDTEGELHLWGRDEYSNIPEKYRFGNDYGISNSLTCVMRKDRTIGCFGRVYE